MENASVKQAASGIDEEAALEAFRDPCWRLGNLYSIRTRDGSIIKFRPRQQQRQIIDLIYRQGCRRIIILKARQLGFSTLLGRRLRGPALLRDGPADLADRPDAGGREAEAAGHRRWWPTKASTRP